jgi:hypothetical protein
VCITSVSSNLRTLGDAIPDVVVVRKMLDVIPKHLEQIVAAVKTLLDPGGSGGNKRSGASHGHGHGNNDIRHAFGTGDGSVQPKKTDKC